MPEFWEKSDYAKREYVDVPLTDGVLLEVEKELGYKLPQAYVQLSKKQNGGMPLKTCYPTTKASSWAQDHVALTGIFSIGKNKTYSLCGQLGSKFWIKEWGYPAIGVYFADCPSAGHDMFCLDYRQCGPKGEPQVVHINQENDYEIVVLAKDFKTFVEGLKNSEDFEDY